MQEPQHSLLLQEEGHSVDGGAVRHRDDVLCRHVAEVGNLLLGGLGQRIGAATNNLNVTRRG